MNQQFSHELKLERASQHLNSLDAKVREWRKRKTHYYDSRFDRESGKQFVYIRFTEPVPAEFRLIIGDCLHNLRSALDNLVYDLVIAYHGDPPPPQFVEYSEFPIFGPKASGCPEPRGGQRMTLGHLGASGAATHLAPSFTRRGRISAAEVLPLPPAMGWLVTGCPVAL